MNVRVVVPPPRHFIMLRALGYGVECGAAAGAAALVLPSLIAAMLGRASFLGVAVVFSLVAAVIGMLVGLACGLVGGIILVVLRRQAAGSRGAARLIAGFGAAVLPGMWTVLMYQRGSGLAVGLILTLVTFGLGTACGLRVLYGKPRPQPRRRAIADSAAVRP